MRYVLDRTHCVWSFHLRAHTDHYTGWEPPIDRVEIGSVWLQQQQYTSRACPEGCFSLYKGYSTSAKHTHTHTMLNDWFRVGHGCLEAWYIDGEPYRWSPCDHACAFLSVCVSNSSRPGVITSLAWAFLQGGRKNIKDWVERKGHSGKHTEVIHSQPIKMLVDAFMSCLSPPPSPTSTTPNLLTPTSWHWRKTFLFCQRLEKGMLDRRSITKAVLLI